MSARKTPKYRHHKPTNQSFVELCGRRFYLGKHNTPESIAAYKRIVQEWRAQGGHPMPTVDITVKELLARWKTHQDVYYRCPVTGEPTSSVHAFNGAIHYLRDYHETPAERFGPLALQACRDAMIADDLSRSTVNKNCGLLRQIFKFGTAQQLISPAVLTGLQTVAGLREGRSRVRETDPVEPVPEGTVAATLPHLPTAVRVMVQIHALTGMRPAEVCIMRPRDIDTRGEIWRYRPSKHKNRHHGKSRTVLIGPRAQELLRPMLPATVDEFIFSPAKSEAERREAVHARRVAACEEIERTYAPSERKAAYKSHHVARLSCGNVPGSNVNKHPARKPRVRYDTGSYARAIANACERAWPLPDHLARLAERRATEKEKDRRARLKADGVWAEILAWHASHRWAPNQLRHSFACNVRNETGVENVQTLLGHSKLSTTELYAEKNIERAAAIMRNVG